MSVRKDARIYCDVCGNCLTAGSNIGTLIGMTFTVPTGQVVHPEHEKIKAFIGPRERLDACFVCWAKSLGFVSWEELKK